MFIRTLACLAVASLSACAYDAGVDSTEITPLVNAPSDDRGGLSVAVSVTNARTFSFVCTQRCDVELRFSVPLEGRVADEGVVASAVIIRPNGLGATEVLYPGTKTVSYAQLAPGTYQVRIAGISSALEVVTLSASWIEGQSPIPGGTAELHVEDMILSDPGYDTYAGGTLEFNCEEPGGCDLSVWTMLSETGERGRVVDDRDGVTMYLRAPGPGHYSARLEERVVGGIGSTLVRGLSPGLHAIDASVLNAPFGQPSRALDVNAEWYPVNRTQSDRLEAFFRARQTALGCASPGPDSALRTAAQAAADELARTDDSRAHADASWSSASSGELSVAYALEIPIVAHMISQYEADTEVSARLTRCERWGLGRAVGTSGMTYQTLRLAPAQ